MMKVYGCKTCNLMRIASMRRSLDCPECRKEMERLALTFLEYTEMDERERQIYLIDLSQIDHNFLLTSKCN